jgi:glycosyltransferase involved in cell wall biosynthesis
MNQRARSHEKRKKSGDAPRKRLLVFVIAYHAEATLKRVLERIPASIFELLDTEILVVDDASTDRTFEIGNAYRADHPEAPLTVLRNEYNQGYGGNQKVGYAYAIAGGFDYVAMVHGDGQYAPEELPRLVEPLLAGSAEAVFGSRMMTRFGALRGGMPLYKFMGNRVLSFAQNRLLGTRLSEFHSGYRIYAVSALAQIPFQLNSNDFHFDTEIIIQLLNAGLRIRELPIPTYYGDEISRVNGLRYARDVMLTTVSNVLHRAGVLYQRRFDPEPEGNAHYDLKLGYASSHTYALQAVPPGASVLDLGGGPAGLATELARQGCKVRLVDRYPAPAQLADKLVVHVQDLNQAPTFEVEEDYLLLLDVIEHLHSPEAFLHGLRAQLDSRPRRLILTTPNIAFVIPRLMLLLGQFNYGKMGILDRTHTRLFTFRSIQQLLRDSGMRITRVRGVPAPFPKVLGQGALGQLVLGLNQALIALSKTLFSYQIYIEAETTPDLDFLLAAARKTQRAQPVATAARKRN